MWNLFNKKNKTDGEHRTLQLITDKGMPFGYVEAYKSLRTNLDFMAGSMDVHTLVITSTVPEESKSNVAVNLAMTMAESGKKVALVDCDLRKPVLHRYLKAGHNVKGVSNVLSNQCTLDEALHELKEMNLTFLPMQNLSQVLAAALLKPKAAKSTAGRPRTKKSKAGESRIPAAPEKNQPGAVC